MAFYATLTGLSWDRALLVFILIIVGRWAINAIYSLYFHPLAKIPGPRIAAISNIPYCRWFLSGRYSYKLLELHNRYGPTVRVGPDEVSFSSAQSFRDIYGARRPGQKPFRKSDFYSGGSFADEHGRRSIISETDPEVHKQMRVGLAGAFSERSIGEQEHLVNVSIDKLVRLVGDRGKAGGSKDKEGDEPGGEGGRGGEGVDITAAFDALTFDITGDLAFGEPFGALDNGKYWSNATAGVIQRTNYLVRYLEEPHPWIAITLNAFSQFEILNVLLRYPTVARIVSVLFRGKIDKLLEDAKVNERYSYETVRRRITRKTERPDFLTRILEDRDPEVVTDRQIAAHVSDLVIAGSDTVATGLSCIVYYLLKNPRILSRLTDEVRSAFQSYSGITYLSTAPLPYLRAVILEGLRIYPPAPFGPPRVAPEGGDIVDGHFIPQGVIVSTNPVAAALSPANFQDPLAFKPERWTDPSKEDNLEASQPWSLGPRGCMGRNLAWLELRITLAKLLWVYDLSFADSPLDWHEEARMHVMWKKLPLMVHAENRGVTIQ